MPNPLVVVAAIGAVSKVFDWFRAEAEKDKADAEARRAEAEARKEEAKKRRWWPFGKAR